MAKIFQAQNTILVTLNAADDLGKMNLRNFSDLLVRKLKFPFPNIIVDMKEIADIDTNGILMLRKINILAKLNNWQLSLFNATPKVLNQLNSNNNRHQLFLCDKMAMVS